MKNLSILMILFFVKSYSQTVPDLLINDWYLYKREMKDGSKPFRFFQISMDKNPQIWQIKNDSYSYYDANTLYPKNNAIQGIQYKLQGDKMIIHPEAYMLIENLTLDSLVLGQNIKGMENDKLERFFFVKKSKVDKEVIQKNLGKDTLFATPFATPHFKNSYGLKKTTQQNEIKNYKFKGMIIFNLINNSIKVEITDLDKNFAKEEEKMIKMLESSFSDWSFNKAHQFKYIKLPFIFGSYRKDNFSYDGFEFFKDDYNESYIFYLTDDKHKQIQSKDYFQKAINLIQKKKYEEAAVYFEKSFTADKYNLDAYYNYITLNFFIGNKIKACETLKFLKSEGQKLAEKEYDEKCLK